ncbi:hypothetical protein GF325_05585 [Candidatus Bathyarchaeota archaeon]|nr:hypothetical protein [Candidatus Bathyarchaeota archaeon]
MKKATLVAHRGFRVGVDENTIEGFRMAADLGMDFIELDVRLSMDGRIIVIHDDTIDRTLDGSGTVSHLQLEELRALRTRGRRKEIAILDEVVSLFQSEIGFMVELKGEGTPEAVASLVEREEIHDDVIISSRSLRLLKEFIFHAGEKLVRTCLNITKCEEFTLEQFISSKDYHDLPIPLDMISLRSSLVAENFIEKCHEFNIDAYCWDFMDKRNSLSRATQLWENGMDGFLLDDPEMARNFKNLFH